MLIFTLCIVTWIISLLNFVHKEDFVIYKTLIYVIYFGITFCPLIHLLAYSRLGKLGPHFNLYDIEIGFLTVLFFLIGGITIYTFRIPERFYPIKFDIYVNILLIFSVTVILFGTYLYFLPLVACTILVL